MTCYQDCHRHLGHLTRETDIARKLLEKYGKASAQAVKELRGETDMPMCECADMLRCLRRDMELERLQAENAKLREDMEDAPKCETCEAMLDCDECLRADDSKKERKRLACENAKLRELVSGLEYCARTSVCDYCCPLYDPSGTDHRRCESLECELGIEVG